MTTRICSTLSIGDESTSTADRMRAGEILDGIGAGIPELADSHASVHLEGSLGAGNLTWDFTVPDDAAFESLGRRIDALGWAAFLAEAAGPDREALRAVVGVEAWVIEPIADHVPQPELAGIKRTNFVRVLESATLDAVDRWSRQLLAFPTHVPAIRNWSVGRTRAFGPGTPRVVWTHAWEQEFETLEGLLEDYMMSPYHWGLLDGWYDPEMPFCIMDPDLAHLYGPATTSVLAWADRGTQRRS